MKILIVYASAGAGHRRAAEAIYNYLCSKEDGINLSVVDILDYTNDVFRFFYSQGYSFLISYLPNLWGFLYHASSSTSSYWFIEKIRHIINRLNTHGFNTYLKQAQPDIVISTHFLPNEMVSYFKRRFKIRLYLISIITDFGVHPFWINQGVDEYYVALHETKYQLVKRGVSVDKIKIRGIPVDLKFSLSLDRKIICRQLGVNEDMFTVLIVTGTIGVGPIGKIFKVLKDKVQLLIVCGQNERLSLKLKAATSVYSKIYGLVDNMDELMAASDIIITKPGGLSISEALVMKLPMIFTYVVPGQESINAGVIKKYKVGIIAKDANNIKDIILRYKDNPGTLEYIKDNIRKISNPFATQEICNDICKGSFK